MHFLSIIIFVALWSFAAHAGPTRDDLRSLAYAGDTAEAEAMFTAVGARVDPASQDYEEQRDLMNAFTVSDPRMDVFTQQWMTDFPQSPYAITARAWFVQTQAILMRGPEYAGLTWPKALEQSSEMFSAAYQLFDTAWAIKPDLVAASDGILRVGPTLGGASVVPDLLDKVMKMTPNIGSMRRAAEYSGRRWGGSANLVISYCEYYIGQINADLNFDQETCEIYLTLSERFDGEGSDAARALMKGNTNPLLDEFRLKATLTSYDEPPQQYLDVLVETIDKDGNQDVMMADVYDRWIGIPKGLPATRPEASENRVAFLAQQIPKDPYNFSLLTENYYLRRQGYGDDTQPVPDPIQDIYVPALKAAPYNANIWSELALAIWYNRDIIPEQPADPFFINAIVYSNHAGQKLEKYVAAKARDYMGARASRGPERTAPKSGDKAEIEACRLVHVLRLYGAACQDAGIADAECVSDVEMVPNYPPERKSIEDLFKLVRDEEDARACLKERVLPVQGLRYSEQTIDPAFFTRRLQP